MLPIPECRTCVIDDFIADNVFGFMTLAPAIPITSMGPLVDRPKI
jgi:hypothetical protein